MIFEIFKYNEYSLKNISIYLHICIIRIQYLIVTNYITSLIVVSYIINGDNMIE